MCISSYTPELEDVIVLLWDGWSGRRYGGRGGGGGVMGKDSSDLSVIEPGGASLLKR